jgi:alkylhydroperoxidase/carboxymuconolactone decarboxylase family protein YurZ
VLPKPPDAYRRFVERYPKLSEAWDLIAVAGKEGSFDEKTARLIKLAIAMGAGREGAVHSGVRKAVAIGVSRDEIEQVVALAAGTLGMPSCVALHSWALDELDKA